jgi:hypothetical protein
VRQREPRKQTNSFHAVQYSLRLQPRGAMRASEKVWADARPAVLDLFSAAQRCRALRILSLGQLARGEATAIPPHSLPSAPQSMVAVLTQRRRD